jgi:hypothetical protein
MCAYRSFPIISIEALSASSLEVDLIQLLPSEDHMQDVITIGRRLIPVEQIALVEPFDPASNPEFKPDKPFKARLVLLNRDTVLAEAAPQEVAEAYGFRMLAEDDMAVNPSIAFRVESFTPTETFNPQKAYATRLKWRDRDDNEQSKLLLTKPETVIALVLRGEAASAASAKGSPRRPPRSRATRRNSRKPEPVRA